MREGAKSYIAPFELNKPIVSGIVARVIASKDDNFQVGDRAISTSPHTHAPPHTHTVMARLADLVCCSLVTTGLLPWQDYIVINPSTHPVGPPFSLQKLDKFPPGVSFSNAVGALGMPGLTAYFGLLGTRMHDTTHTTHTALLPVWLALVHRHL